MTRILVLALAISAAACGGKQSTPTTSGEASGSEGATPAPPMTSSPSMTAADCNAAGGQVVGDIGDGAVHRPDYRCANGTPPIGHIAPEAGQPVAVEGAVCCR